MVKKWYNNFTIILGNETKIIKTKPIRAYGQPRCG